MHPFSINLLQLFQPESPFIKGYLAAHRVSRKAAKSVWLESCLAEVTKLQPQTSPLGPMLLSQITVNNSDLGREHYF